MKLENTSAIVTGAASGLGRETSEQLIAAGVKVFGLDLQPGIEKAEPLDGITYIAADVTDESSLNEAFEQIKKELSAPLRIIINCAGIATPGRILSRKGVHDLAQFAKVVNVNLMGTFNVLALGAEIMAETEPVDEDGQRGVIINTASVAAFEGQIGQAAYAASKGGVRSMTVPAARDLAQYGIRVNTIAPGIVMTPMMAGLNEEFQKSLAESVPFPHRLARPDEFGKLAIDIIEHDYINGQTIRMDGALIMSPR